MGLSRRQKWSLTICFGLVCVGLVLYSRVVNSSPPPPQASVKLLPLIDEDPASAQRPLSEVVENLRSLPLDEATQTYDNSIRSRVRHRQFADLDRFAAELRKSKARFPGGEWMLYHTYERMSEPAAGRDAPDTDWNTHLKIIEEWMKAFPESMTARVTYADTLTNYAWKARGGGWSKDVTEKGWSLFEERNQKALEVLMDTKGTPARCPQWYYLMERIALAQGWRRVDFDRIFDEAVIVEPLYTAVYSQKADYLLPRWYGKPGEWQRFIDEAANRVGGEEGDALFYRVFAKFAEYTDDFNEIKTTVHHFWPRLQRGYRSTETLYKTSPDTMNEYGRLAWIADDRNEARAVFTKIGEDWSDSEWNDREQFERARRWAFTTDPGT